MKVFIYIITIIVIAHSQIVLTPSDSFNIKDKPDIIKLKMDTIITNEVVIDEKLKELNILKIKIDSISKSLYSYDPVYISIKSKDTKRRYDSLRINLKKMYPISMQTIDNGSRLYTASRKFRAIGFFQIVAGGIGTVVTVINANKKINYTIDKQNISVKNEWTGIHTAALTLSLTSILNGIISMSF